MDMIYGKAFCTIAVAHGEDADAGPPGFFTRKPMVLNRHGIRLATGEKDNQASSVVTVNVTRSTYPLEHCLKESIWNTRGWVLQEQVPSRRIIYVTSDHAYFQCTEGTWWERDALEVKSSDIAQDIPPSIARPSETSLHHPFFKLKNMRPTTGPSYTRRVFGVYSQLVETYTMRQLTYQSDILNAFTGILSVMDLFFQSDNVSGLPASPLDLALLWTPAGPLTRRKQSECSESESGEPFEPPAHPSRSLIGWQGAIEYLAPIMHNELGIQLPTPMIDGVAYRYRGCTRNIELRKRAVSYGNRQRGIRVGLDETTESSAQTGSSNEGDQDIKSAILEFYAETVDMLYFHTSVLPGYLSLSEKPNVFTESRHDVTGLSDRASNHCGVCHVAERLEDEPEEYVLAQLSLGVDIAASTEPHHKPRMRYWSGSLPGEDQVATAREFLQTRRRRELVAISQYDPAIVEAEVLSGHSSVQGEISLYDEMVFPRTGMESGLVNALVIKWKGLIAERETVVQIHAKAWKQASPKRKLIRLV